MKSICCISLLLVFLPQMRAQNAQLPANWAGAGAAYNGYSRPQVNGWASYAKLLTEKGGGLYSFTSWDVTSARTKPFTTQTSARTGIATIVKQVGPIYVLGFGDAGMASSSDGFGGAFSGGGIGVWKIGKTSFTFVAAARVLRVSNGATQTVYEVGFGRVY